MIEEIEKTDAYYAIYEVERDKIKWMEIETEEAVRRFVDGEKIRLSDKVGILSDAGKELEN